MPPSLTVRQAVAVSIAILFSFEPPALAASPDLIACATSYEQGQRLQRQGALVRAREQLVVCARDVCPATLRDDCVRWLRDVETALPTVVPVARLRGEPAKDLKVYVDGVLLEHSQGRAVEVDPGEHLFRFEVGASAPVEKRVIVVEGQKGREIPMNLVDSSAPAPVPAPSAATAPLPVPLATRPRRPVPWPVWVLGGVGLAGIGAFTGFGLTGRKQLGDLDAQGCRPNCDHAAVSSAQQSFLVADVSLAIGVVALGVAGYFFFTRPAVDEATR